MGLLLIIKKSTRLQLAELIALCVVAAVVILYVSRFYFTLPNWILFKGECMRACACIYVRMCTVFMFIYVYLLLIVIRQTVNAQRTSYYSCSRNGWVYCICVAPFPTFLSVEIEIRCVGVAAVFAAVVAAIVL